MANGGDERGRDAAGVTARTSCRPTMRERVAERWAQSRPTGKRCVRRDSGDERWTDDARMSGRPSTCNLGQRETTTTDGTMGTDGGLADTAEASGTSGGRRDNKDEWRTGLHSRGRRGRAAPVWRDEWRQLGLPIGVQ